MAVDTHKVKFQIGAEDTATRVFRGVESSLDRVQKRYSQLAGVLGTLGIGLGVGYFASLAKGTIDEAIYKALLKKEKVIANGKINHSHPNTKALKIFINLQIIPQKMFKKYPETLSVGIYGSAAKGEDTEESDLDLYVFTNKNQNLASLSQELKKISPKAKPLFLNKDKFNLIKEENPLFYHSLIFSSITIYGEKLDNL